MIIQNFISSFKRGILLAAGLFSFAAIAQHSVVVDVVGTGEEAVGDNNVDPLTTSITIPWLLAEDGAGNIFFAEFGSNRIRKIDATTGLLSWYVGTGSVSGVSTPFVNGSPALSANTSVGGLLYDGDSLIFTDFQDGFVRYLKSDGNVYNFAGGDQFPRSGDGGPALDSDVGVHGPIGMIRNHVDGNLYWIEASSYAIRYVDSEGIIRTFAGDTIGGTPWNSGHTPDGTYSPITFTLNVKGGLAQDSDGNIYFSTFTDEIRKLDPTGAVLTTVAGKFDDPGYDGDGLSGVDSRLDTPTGLWMTDDDKLYFADRGNGLIRMYDVSTGLVHDVAGVPGETDYNGNNKEVSEAHLHPFHLIMASNGDIYFSDHGGGTNEKRIRKITTCQNPSITGYSGVPDIVCTDSTIQIVVEGDLGDADKWVWKELSCSATAITSGETFDWTVGDFNTVLYVMGDTVENCTNDPSCTAIPVNLNCPTGMYSAFSPNGDGKNDVFEIPLMDTHAINTVTIFNRWGDEIKTIVNFNSADNPWDGTDNKNAELEAGIYYFIGEINGTSVAKGWVHLLK